MYNVSDYLKLFVPGDTIYISNDLCERDPMLLLYKHPKGAYAEKKCKKSFDKCMRRILKHYNAETNSLVLSKFARMDTFYHLDRTPITWEEFLHSEIIALHQTGSITPSGHTVSTVAQIGAWRCTCVIGGCKLSSK